MKRPAEKATTTRPSVARLLISAGYDVKKVKSVWDPSRVEWEFTLDNVSARMISEYYAKIGRVPPFAVRKFLQKQQEGEA